ncbi:MAG: MmcQ/YjbR family DNA-binding protein [Cyclobacteriaceae bacterium]|nr:MmcQ/YjbR family DNA-binding protein [Cyclobacteriaceae bacterium]MCK5368263.1 MmcQ/YjbR family DNA-binding protein [Cyclobacteriaceae bacterium]MCK5470070.1 MmcQ/YjbR family DNA-binding protein [Cyclobacteriaceae bacterium]MCK5705904.1 MmcQ/YjbR family DNA-binding protein [Cyclobacteriaceae bacterium]
MNIESFRDFCMAKKGVSEDFPFDEGTLVFKVMGKMFALTDVDLFKSVNLKCDPEWAIELREKYPSIIPGYHMNKKHWNTVEMDDSLPDSFIKELVTHSYERVVEKLPRALKSEFKNID